MIQKYRFKNFFLTIIILCFSNFLIAQNKLVNKIPNQEVFSNLNKDTIIKKLPYSKGTFRTKQLISEFNQIRSKKKYQSDTLYNDIKSEFLLKNINAIDYVSAFIQVVDEKYIDTLESLGVKIVGPKQKLIIGLIPIEKIDLITELPYIIKIEVGTKASKNDLTTNKLTKSDSVQKGIQLPQSYTGKNVIIGIIDEGFDYTHPNFYDSTGTIFRIKAIWNQSDKTGTSNISSLPYGSMYYDSLKIISQKTDDTSGVHGSHVAGIAAGSGLGYPNINNLRGVAYESEIVLTTYAGPNALTTDIASSVYFILNYANSVKRPCVINMSLGSQYGPHDGSSFFDTYIDNLLLANPNGNIIVGAAGNSGQQPIHISSIHTATDSIRYAFIRPYKKGTQVANTYFKTYDRIEFELYGEVDKSLSLGIGIFNIKTKIYENTPIIFDLKNPIDTVRSIANTGQSIFYGIRSDTSNKRKSARIWVSGSAFQNLYNLDSNKLVTLVLNSKNNSLNSWIASPRSNGGDNPSFTQSFNFLNVNQGDSLMTISEIGGTGKSVISVGSYNSNIGNITYAQSVGDTLLKASIFSSFGNTADGRLKPDVSAPGQYLASSFNSWRDTSYQKIKNSVIGYYPFNNRFYPYGWSAGTSMAAPAVAGIIALWLQASPLLTFSQARDIIKKTSISDIYTGALPNKTYGYGKIDAYNGIKYLLAQMPSKPRVNIKNDTTLCIGDSIIINAPSGQKTYTWFNGSNKLTNNTNSLVVKNAGNYFYAVQGTNDYWSNYSDTLKLNVNQLPTAPAVTNSVSYCQGVNAVALNANVTIGNTLLWFGTNATGGTGVTVAPAPSTSNTGVFNYYVTQKNSTTGCISPRTSISVTINPIPTIPIITRDTANYLVSSALKNVWYKDGQALSDSSQRVKYTPPGQFTVKAVQNGCVSAFSSPYYLITDVINISKDEFIKIAPNPFKNQLNLDFVIRGYQKLNLEVFDMASGTKVSSKPNLTAGIPIYLDQLSAGTYIIRITSNDGKINYQFKMIKI